MFKVIATFRLSRKIRRLYGLGKKNSARRLKAAACRVGSITFKMYFNYTIQITFLKSNSNTFSIALAMTCKIQNAFLESN